MRNIFPKQCVTIFITWKNICDKLATTTTYCKRTRFRKHNGHFSDACSNDTSFWHTMAFYFRISFRYFRGWIYINIYIFTHTDFFKAHILKEYQLNRFYGWLAPYKYDAQGYQLRQAFLATGSGEMQGKGWENGQVYFPEPHTDFIFTNVAEQFGFLGASVIISLFLTHFRMIHIALESNDPFGSYICAGTIGMFTFQVFQNIGMTIGLLPITGITLPLMSYGGSSLLTYMIAIDSF